MIFFVTRKKVSLAVRIGREQWKWDLKKQKWQRQLHPLYCYLLYHRACYFPFWKRRKLQCWFFPQFFLCHLSFKLFFYVFLGKRKKAPYIVLSGNLVICAVPIYLLRQAYHSCLSRQTWCRQSWDTAWFYLELCFWLRYVCIGTITNFWIRQNMR